MGQDATATVDAALLTPSILDAIHWRGVEASNRAREAAGRLPARLSDLIGVLKSYQEDAKVARDCVAVLKAADWPAADVVGADIAIRLASDAAVRSEVEAMLAAHPALVDEFARRPRPLPFEAGLSGEV